MGQITFALDNNLEQDFRKKVGMVFGARKNSIGIALRFAIREFLVNDTLSSETIACRVSKQIENLPLEVR